MKPDLRRREHGRAGRRRQQRPRRDRAPPTGKRLAPLLHPYVHWTTAAEEKLRGRRNVIARLSKDPPPAPPAYHELRDGQVYRWIDMPG